MKLTSPTRLLKQIKSKLSTRLHPYWPSAQVEKPFSLDGKSWLVLFDPKWYLEQYSDVRESGISPLQHYWDYGMREGRNPNAFFDSLWYLNQNPDVRESGISPLQHYWEYGMKEGRKTSPPVEIRLPNAIEIFLKPYKQFFEMISSPFFDMKSISTFISFPKPVNPLVSIIIPVYEKAPYTLQCLYAIHKEFSYNFEIEVIVVDDCSPDKSGQIFDDLLGVVCIKNQLNLGFVRSCNIGADSATGEYLCFLNNDTLVMPGWLEELIATFNNFPGTGLVGSQLIYPNGQLQEAGGIVWQDGSACNFGRLQDPEHPIYNYAREVDYCSGASIVIPAKLFKEVGGFDEIYAPAYYEDTDLALQIRDLGYRVIYQPLSKVVHFEGISSGTDLTQGIKSYQVINQKTFFNRWKSRLENYQVNGDDVDRAKDRSATRRALYIDKITPTPDKDSGSIDALNHMLMLREMQFQVTFVAEDQFAYDFEYTNILQKNGIEVLYRPFINSIVEHLDKFGARYDLVILCRAEVAKNTIHFIKRYCIKAKIIYHVVDLHFLRLESEFALTKNHDTYVKATKMKALELFLIKEADVTTVLSEYEFEILNKECKYGCAIRLLPFVRNDELTDNEFYQRSGILFIGGYKHEPNIDAAKHLALEIMPYLRKLLPGITLVIAGSNTPKSIYALEMSDIKVLGYVEKLMPILNDARILVAPLRYGAGIKGKVASAMNAGLPVVASPIAAEGMDLQSFHDLIIAEGPEKIAEGIAYLYSNEELWNEIRANAFIHAKKKWGIETGWSNLAEILEQLDLKISPPSYPIKPYSENRMF
jgi:GT2 family glycosyltransferase/glycosyltransferase involved in cell wall biosynthesis